MDVEVRFNKKTMQGLKRVPDDILFGIAKQTLDRSYTKIPMSHIKNHAGTLRRSSISGGVRGGNGDYYIGSYTKYAKYVWNMPDSTNWSTKGTNNKWYARTLKEHGRTIIDSSINQAWRKDML